MYADSSYPRILPESCKSQDLANLNDIFVQIYISKKGTNQQAIPASHQHREATIRPLKSVLLDKHPTSKQAAKAWHCKDEDAPDLRSPDQLNDAPKAASTISFTFSNPLWASNANRNARVVFDRTRSPAKMLDTKIGQNLQLIYTWLQSEQLLCPPRLKQQWSFIHAVLVSAAGPIQRINI